MKKIAVYDPYLDVLGGGEKLLLSIVKVFEEYGYSIDVLWNDPTILDSLKKKLNLTFKTARVIPVFTSYPFMNTLVKTAEYDYFFYVTDGSYFFSLARNNFVFSMYPQRLLYKNTMINKLKWFQWKFIVISAFTKRFVDQWTGTDNTILCPYIDIFALETVKSFKKDKIILTVGRFFTHLHAKRQDILIKSFKQLQQKNRAFKDFTLYLIGGLKEEDKKYFNELVRLAEGDSHIVFLPNASYETVSEYYKKALFYWHATGYDVDEKLHPEAVEHLGLTPLEAMASGCIVLCHASGGPKEMIKQGENGFLYHTIEELIDQTNGIYGEKNKLELVKRNGYEYVKKNFSYEVFKKMITSYFRLTNDI